MENGRLQWRLMALAAGCVLAVEVLRRLTDGSGIPRWVWSAVLLAGVLLFTRAVFTRLAVMDRSLQAHQQRAELLFSATAVGIAMVGDGCRILRLNPAAERLTGWRSDEIVGRSVCSDLFALTEDGKPICFESCLGLPQPNGADILRTMTLQTKQGRKLAVAVNVTPVRQDEFYLLFWDVSERTRLERELAKRRRQAESLYEVGREMAATVDLDRNIERLLDKARTVMEADVAGWGTLHDTSLELDWHVMAGAERGLGRAPLPLRGTVAGRVLAAGRAYVTQNLRADVAASPEAEALVSTEGLAAAMAVPLQVRDRHYGVLFVGHRRPTRMSDEDLLLLSNLGSHLGTAVENNDLLGRMQQVAALEERQRLAREMHDSFGQTLTYFGMRLHLMESMAVADQTDDLIAEIKELRSVLHDAHQDVRRSIYQLKDPGPPLAPLWDRWAEGLRLFQSQTGIQTEMVGREALPAHLPERVETQLIRVVQEALANVRNHSGAAHVVLEIFRNGHDLVVTVTDDGCGFVEAQIAAQGEYHFGMGIMRERVESLGGRLEVHSEPGRGTSVRALVPVPGGGGNDHVATHHTAGR